MLKIIPVGTLDIDEEMCPCIMDWLKAYDHVNRTKLIQILQGADIDWPERLVSKLYMDQSVNLSLDQAETKSLKFGKGVRQAFYSTCSANNLPRNLLKGLKTSEQEK
jgi:hypothetical protein